VSKPSEIAAVLLGLSVVTLTVLHQQAGDLYAVPDRGDPIFSIWRMAWVQHQLANDPRHLFDANIFYPLPATLTYSDSMVLPAVAAAPLAWAGMHPVVAYNLVLLAALILSGLSAYLLVRGLGCGRASAWIAAVSFTLCPFRINHLSHLELQMTMWMPLVLLAVHRILREGQRRYALVLGLALAAQWYSSMYYGLFLLLYAAVFGAVLAGAWRAATHRVFYAAAGVCLAAILVWPLARVYTASAPARGVRSAESVAEFSAVPSDYLRPGVGSPTYRAFLPRVVHAERALFPGVVPLALAAAGAWPPLTATHAAFVVAGVVAFDSSLGVHGVLYPVLYRFISPFQSVRVPARFGMLVGLTIAVLAGAGAGRVLTRVPGPRARIAAVALFTFALMVDGWARYDRLPMWRHPPAVYASIPQTGAVLFEFPIHPQPERFAENLPYMYFSIWHWTPMVNGYSGFNPGSYTALIESTSAFPDAKSLDYLGRTGVTHIAVHCRLWEPEVCATTVNRLETMPQVRRIATADWYGAPSSLYELGR
jgi:membrane protein YfhO